MDIKNEEPYEFDESSTTCESDESSTTCESESESESESLSFTREWCEFCDKCEYCLKEEIYECMDKVEFDPCETCYKQCGRKELNYWKERHTTHLKMISKMLEIMTVEGSIR